MYIITAIFFILALPACLFFLGSGNVSIEFLLSAMAIGALIFLVGSLLLVKNLLSVVFNIILIIFGAIILVLAVFAKPLGLYKGEEDIMQKIVEPFDMSSEPSKPEIPK